MRRGAGKGKISHDLVAASCAAVLAVYAAGYVRTRDAARRLVTQAQKPRLTPRVLRAAEHTPPSGAAPRQLPAPARAAHELAVTAAPASSSEAGGSPRPRAPRPANHAHVSRPSSGPTSPQSAAARTPVPGGAEPVVAAGAPAPTADDPHAVAPVPMPEELAAAAIPASTAPGSAVMPQAKWRDGTYTGVGDSAHGDIEARVVIKNGRIVEAGISACNTRYPCSVIDSLIRQPLTVQGPITDYVSHATESSYAYYFGLVEALKAALDQPATGAADPQ